MAAGLFQVSCFFVYIYFHHYFHSIFVCFRLFCFQLMTEFVYVYLREFDKQCAPIYNDGPLLVFDSSTSTHQKTRKTDTINDETLANVTSKLEKMTTSTGSGTSEETASSTVFASMNMINRDTSGSGLYPLPHTHWSSYYATNARDPLNMELSPWLQKRIDYLGNLHG